MNSEPVNDPFSVDSDVPPPSQRQTAWTASTESFSTDTGQRSDTTPAQVSAGVDSSKPRTIPEKPPRNSLGNSLNNNNNTPKIVLPPQRNSTGNLGRHGSSSSGTSSKLSDGKPSKEISRHLSQLSLTETGRSVDVPCHTRRSHVIYHSAMMEISQSEELDKFICGIVSNFCLLNLLDWIVRHVLHT